MKTSKIITLAMMALALMATPALAQRGGGGGSRGGGGGSHSSSVSSSRSGGSSHSSYSGSSRSSSSSSSSRSYSSSSSSSSRSYNAPSRSSSSNSSNRSYNAPSRSNSGSSSVRSSAAPSREGARRAPEVRGAREAGVTPRSAAPRSGVRDGGVAPRRADGPAPSRRDVAGGSPRVGSHSGAPTDAPGGRVSTGRANDVTPYARPGRPGGVMPPSHRPIHPAPYFHHPYHHHYVHCHPIFWDPLPPRPWYWPGFWLYCNSYWYDYHVTDVVVVRDYVQNKYNVDLVTYGISGDIMYAIVRDGGDTYLQVYDKDDHLLAEQKINRKYCNMVIDSENGGCWISKKNEKDPLLFIWADGQLLIYEAD